MIAHWCRLYRPFFERSWALVDFASCHWTNFIAISTDSLSKAASWGWVRRTWYNWCRSLFWAYSDLNQHSSYWRKRATGSWSTCNNVYQSWHRWSLSWSVTIWGAGASSAPSPAPRSALLHIDVAMFACCFDGSPWIDSPSSAEFCLNCCGGRSTLAQSAALLSYLGGRRSFPHLRHRSNRSFAQRNHDRPAHHLLAP